MSKHSQDDTFSDFLFLYEFSLLLLCNIVSKISFPCCESGYHRFILCHRYSNCIVFSTEYVSTCTDICAYIHVHGKIPFLLFSDVIQLFILRCANKTLYNQLFCMDTLYSRITVVSLLTDKLRPKFSAKIVSTLTRKKNYNLLWYECFRLVTRIQIHGWLWNDTHSF